MSLPIVAVLDDMEDFRRDVSFCLREEYTVVTYSTWDTFRESLEKQIPDVLILDLNLGDGQPDGFQVHRMMRDAGHVFPVILMTIIAGTRTTTRAMEEGIPYINKDTQINMDVLGNEVASVLRLAMERAEHSYLKELFGERAPRVCPWNRGGGGPVLDELKSLAGSQAPVVFLGEPGTGKYTTAMWLHASGNGDLPFHEVSAYGLGREAFLTRLLGRREESGRTQPGAISAAGVGTVFIRGLDDLDEATLEDLRGLCKTSTYRPLQGKVELKRSCRFMFSLRCADLTSLQIPGLDYWRSISVLLPGLRHHLEDLEFHARWTAESDHLDGLGKLQKSDLKALEKHPFTRNFHDLRYLVRHGAGEPKTWSVAPSSLGSALNIGTIAQYMPARAMDHFEYAYMTGVLDLLGGWGEVKWQEHTGWSRAKYFNKKRWYESGPPV